MIFRFSLNFEVILEDEEIFTKNVSVKLSNAKKSHSSRMYSIAFQCHQNLICLIIYSQL